MVGTADSADQNVTKTAEIAHLRASRRANKAVLTKLRNEITALLAKPKSEVTDDDVIRLESILERLTDKKLDIGEINSKLLSLITDDDEVNDEVAQAEECMLDVQLLIRKLQSTLMIAPTQTEAIHHSVQDLNTNFDHRQQSLKLPALDLPTFSGNYRDWLPFWNLFESTVDGNESIAPIQKLHYLKASLRGDAARILCNLPLTSGNYEVGKKLLKDRYSNKRAISRAHIQALFSHPNIQEDSPQQLRKLIESFSENKLALDVLGYETSYWDPILIYMVTEKLDQQTRKEWERYASDETKQTMGELNSFLETQARALEASQKGSASKTKPDKSEKLKQAQTYSTEKESCPHCSDGHRIYSCPKFKELKPKDRAEVVKKSNLCFNCLRSGHQTKTCKSSSSCRQCKKRHHSLLHRDSNDAGASNHVSPHSGHEADTFCSVALPTAMVKVWSSDNYPISCRAMLDSGSQLSFISEECAQRCNLKRHPQSMTISGVGKQRQTINSAYVQLIVKPTHHSSVETRAFVLPKLTQMLPSKPISTAEWTHAKFLPMADPSFATPGKVDIILGADVFDEVVLEDKVQESCGAYLRKTVFGWVVTGRTDGSTPNQAITAHETIIPNFDLKKFWEVEEVPQQKMLTEEELSCEKHFTETTKQNEDGRLIVKLPFNEKKENLGESFNQAKKRF